MIGTTRRLSASLAHYYWFVPSRNLGVMNVVYVYQVAGWPMPVNLKEGGKDEKESGRPNLRAAL